VLQQQRFAPTDWHRNSGEPEAFDLLKAYRTWKQPPKARSDALEAFAPALMSLGQRAWAYDPSQPAAGTTQIWEWERGILHLCLYADRIWVPDPLELLARDLTHEGMSIAVHQVYAENVELAMQIAQALDQDLSELVNAGVIALYPPISIYRESVAAGLFGTVRAL
jgi:hypothetical protein